MRNTTRTIAPRELFAASYAEYFHELVRYTQSKVSDPEIAKDLVQEAFLKMWVYLRNGKEIRNMRSFLYRILKNMIVDWYRKRKTLSLDTLLDYGYELSDSDSERMINELDGETAIALISKLPAPYRDILRMKYEHNLSVEEIAQRSGKSNNSVSVSIHRGLLKLKLLWDRLPPVGRGAVPV